MAGKKYEDYVQKGRPVWAPVWKIITGILFSHMGLFVLAIGYGAAGAYVFILLELPGKYLSSVNTGFRVFKGEIQNHKDFWLKINIPKGNY